MARLNNYIPDTNPFNLAGPPDSFLRKLWEYDPSLVIMASKQGYYYRLGQKGKKLDLPAKIVHDVLKEEADSRMMASYGVVPITTVLATANWDNPLIFEALTLRAPWRQGGADAFEKKVLAQERGDKIEAAKKQDETNTYRAKDAWQYYKKKAGLQTNAFTFKGKSRPATPGTLLRPDGKPVDYRPDVAVNWDKKFMTP